MRFFDNWKKKSVKKKAESQSSFERSAVLKESRSIPMTLEEKEIIAVIASAIAADSNPDTHIVIKSVNRIK